MNQRVIKVVKYRSKWAENYLTEHGKLQRALKATMVTIDHIGSTSIEGLWAKPIIDILICTEYLNDIYNSQKNLELIGYECLYEHGIENRCFFRKGSPQPSYHLHCFERGHWAINEHLVFRDYLRHHKSIAQEYAKIKRYAAENCDNNISKYMALKTDFIQTHMALAKKWARQM